MSEERSVMILVAYPAGVQEPLRASKGASRKQSLYLFSITFRFSSWSGIEGPVDHEEAYCGKIEQRGLKHWIPSVVFQPKLSESRVRD